ncbi:MAG: hypothetical protein QF815_00970, partial [Candidatus Peribacteraceae bacterium]|nr:hypothetical protein [Candidatus Peribacteraceae bacterium]
HIDVVVLEECEETDILREEFSDHPDVHVQEIGFLVDYHARRLTKSGPAFAAMYEMIKLGRIKGDELRCVRDFLHALNTGIDFHKLYNIAHRDATKLRRRMAKGFEVLHNANRITDDLVETTLREVVQIPRDVRKEETSYMMCHYEEDGQLLATRRRFKKPDQRHLGTLRRLWTEAGQDTPFECTMENLQTIVEYQEQRESERQSQPATLQKEREFSYEDMYYAATEIRAERKTGHDTEIAREVGEFGSQHIEGRYRMMYATNSKERIREAVEIVKQVFTPMSRVSNAGRMHLATNWKGHFQDEKRMGFWKTLTYLIPNYRALKKVTGGVRAMQRLARGDESTYDMELHELLDTLSTQNDEAYEHFQRHGNELCRVSPAEMKYLLQKETRFRKNGIKCLSEADQKGVTSMYMHDTSMDNRYFASATSTTARRAAAIALVNPDLARTYLKMTIGAHKHGSIPTYHRLATMREDDPVYESIAGSYGNLGDGQIYQAVTEMDGDVNTIAENLAVIHLECQSLAKDFFRYAKYNQRGKMDIIMSLEGPDYYHLPEIRGKLSRARDDELAQIEFGKPILGQLK